jgi:hypothetical protein
MKYNRETAGITGRQEKKYYEDQQRNRKATEKLPVIAGFDT